MVELVLVALMELDGKGPCMGNSWFAMKTLDKHMQSLRDPPFSLSPKLVSNVENQFQHQWRMMKTYIHYAKALFNPYILGNNWIHDNVNVKDGIKHVLWKMSIDAT
jgi:hypothetical protein